MKWSRPPESKVARETTPGGYFPPWSSQRAERGAVLKNIVARLVAREPFDGAPLPPDRCPFRGSTAGQRHALPYVLRRHTTSLHAAY